MRKQGMRLTVSMGVFLLGAASAWTQTIPPSLEAGRVEQRFRQPRAAHAKPVVRHGLESTMPPSQAQRIKLSVKRFVFVGNTVFSNAELAAMGKGLTGKRISLRDIFDLAARITSRYGKAGYVLSRAIIPPQELSPSGAVVRIRILEGYVDKVVWPRGKLQRYRDFFTSYARAITSERPIRAQTLERYLLLANDLPGLTFSTTLTPSRTNALASTLMVTMKEDHERFRLSLDNRGTKGSGPLQPSATIYLDNALGLHDALTFGYTAAAPNRRRRISGMPPHPPPLYCIPPANSVEFSPQLGILHGFS